MVYSAQHASDGLTEAAGSILTDRTSTGWRYYTRLAINSFATMLDLGLFTLGAALVGLGLAVLLAGFDVVDAETNLSTGSVLVAALVLSVVGTFSMGIASEGPARRASSFIPHNEYERAIGRALASIAVGVILMAVSDRLVEFADDLSAPLVTGIELIRTTGQAALWPVALIGVPLAWGVHQSRILGDSAEETDLPIMFATWVVAVILLR
jgi:hypothetical protein